MTSKTSRLTQGLAQGLTQGLTRRALVAGLAVSPLAACGIKGPNRRPDDGDPAYPRRYPPPDSVRPEGRRAPNPPATPEGEQDSQ